MQPHEALYHDEEKPVAVMQPQSHPQESILGMGVIADAIYNIKKKILRTDLHIDYRKDIRWIFHNSSTFEFWCDVARVDPEKIRSKLRELTKCDRKISKEIKNY